MSRGSQKLSLFTKTALPEQSAMFTPKVEETESLNDKKRELLVARYYFYVSTAKERSLTIEKILAI
ncbi:MAG: hypothetical protein EBZ77_02600, partial [Chitinophagia bacterium]|nr:hypothetical protein [Chitinophagia bacterium]